MSGLRLARRGAIAKPTAAPAFDPLSLSPLQWFKADALALSDGAQVNTWPDSSGNSRDATRGSGTPKFKTAILNGQPVVRFTSVAPDIFTSTLPSQASPYSIFLVAKAGSAASFAALVANSGGNGGVYRYSSGDALAIYATGSVVNATSPSLATAFRVISTVFNGASSQGWVDGTSVLTGNPGTAAWANTLIGAAAGPVQGLDGDIAEILIYGGAMSTGNRQSVQGYLGTKYGITVA